MMRNRKRSEFHLLVVSAALVASTGAQCISIADFICRVSSLSMLCASVTQAGLASDLKSKNFTIFAPTNKAFFNLGDRLGLVLGNPDFLSDVILYHAVDGILSAEDLTCSGTVEMANGQTSRTECQEDSIFQKGGGNSLSTMPQVVASNINLCNGLVHMTDEVLLPAELGPESQIPSGCKSIGDIVCESSLFSTLCTAMTQAGLLATLKEGPYTLFGPTNDAFAKLGDTLNSVLADKTLLTDILLNHVVDGIVYSSSLECGGSVSMANGKETTTVCQDDAIFQTVKGVEAQIVLSDVHACSGAIHLLSDVLVPSMNETAEVPVTAPVRVPVQAPVTAPIKAPVTAPVGKCRSIVEIICSTDNFSTLCAAVKQAGLEDTLSEGSLYTLMAPTNMAFSNLGATLDLVLADNDLLTDILLFHLAEGVVYSTDLMCDGDILMANGKSTLTVCENDDVYITGEGNDPNAMPMIVLVDIPACSEIIHAVDEVILP